MQSYHEFLSEVLIPKKELQDRIQALGDEISQDYAGQDLHMICILRGGVMFLTDLMRVITVPHSIDFMAISSYGVGVRQASGHIRLTMDLRDDIQGRNVLLVEDIVDSGYTLQYLYRIFGARQPASLRTAVLLSKPDRHEVEVGIDYLGFQIPDVWVVGYGLDYADRFRTLPYIGLLKSSVYEEEDD